MNSRAMRLYSALYGVGAIGITGIFLYLFWTADRPVRSTDLPVFLVLFVVWFGFALVVYTYVTRPPHLKP